jgi:hypothetical protein
MKWDDEQDEVVFTAQVRDALNATPLSEDVVDRLRVARRAAVAAIEPRRVSLPTRWLPMGAMAATVVAAVLLRGPTNAPALPFDDDQQLAVAQDIDLLENLEFAAWMVESDASSAI